MTTCGVWFTHCGVHHIFNPQSAYLISSKQWFASLPKINVWKKMFYDPTRLETYNILTMKSQIFCKLFYWLKYHSHLQCYQKKYFKTDNSTKWMIGGGIHRKEYLGCVNFFRLASIVFTKLLFLNVATECCSSLTLVSWYAENFYDWKKAWMRSRSSDLCWRLCYLWLTPD